MSQIYFGDHLKNHHPMRYQLKNRLPDEVWGINYSGDLNRIIGFCQYYTNHIALKESDKVALHQGYFSRIIYLILQKHKTAFCECLMPVIT